MAEFLEFTDIYHQSRGTMYPGRLKLQTSCITYKNLHTGKLDKHQASDILEVNWMKRSKGGCLKVTFINEDSTKYDGFKESDFDLLSEYMKRAYNVTLKKKDMSLKGWNWGDVKFKGNIMDFVIDNLTAVEVPLSDVSNVVPSKNEVAIEFHPNDDAPVQVVEMRLYVPTDNSDVDPVAELHKKVMERADVVQAIGDAITTFHEVQCLTPRGRYNIKVYPTFLQLHGKTFDYKIPYTTILRLFLLPHPDHRQYFFMLSLDPPIKQGQTRYHYLVLLFSKEVDLNMQLSISEEDLQNKYAGKLKSNMNGPEHEMVSRVMKALVNKKITVPGSFQGHTKSHSLACSYRAATGYLYPLERGFVFVHKPPLHIRCDEIGCVNFARSAGSTRYFDFDIETTGGSVYNFVGIEKDEYGQLYDFVKQKGLRVKNIDKTDGKTLSYAEVSMEDSDEEDDDYDDDQERKKHRSDDEEESDEDFKPEGSGSEPDDEYDSQHESSSEGGGDDDDTEKKQKKHKKHKKEKKEKKKEGDEEEEEEDEDRGKKRKHDSDEEEEEEEEEKEKEKEKKKIKKAKKEVKDTKKKKKEKDPNKPKRPQSAYFLWLGENRAKLKSEFPGISITDLTKKAGERWKEVSDKSKWEKMAAKEKEKYEAAMEEYNRGVTASGESKKKESKKAEEDGFKSKEIIEDDDDDDDDDKNDDSD